MNYSAFYSSNAESFLSSRNLSFKDLREIAEIQHRDASVTLLTSSSVHGIANTASDIDLICITGSDAASDNAMASQVYHAGHHMEVVAFSAGELEQANTALRMDSGASARDRLLRYKQWDKQQKVTRKYIERIVSGVATDSGVPYVGQQTALGNIWAIAAFDASRQSTAFAMLAFRCGESCAAAGYAVNALLHLMNALLSTCGWTVSNKKWTLRRWRYAEMRSALPLDHALAEEIDRLWQAIYPLCTRGLSASLAAALAELSHRAENHLGYRDDYCGQPLVLETTDTLRFLPASDLVIRDGRGSLLRAASIPADLTSAPIHLMQTDPVVARTLLSGARAGVVRLSLSDSQRLASGVSA